MSFLRVLFDRATWRSRGPSASSKWRPRRRQKAAIDRWDGEEMDGRTPLCFFRSPAGDLSPRRDGGFRGGDRGVTAVAKVVMGEADTNSSPRQERPTLTRGRLLYAVHSPVGNDSRFNRWSLGSETIMFAYVLDLRKR